jgi:SAM-dependent methyltransferase
VGDGVNKDRYVIDSSLQYAYLASRDTTRFLPFLLPHLRSGQHVLDVGCGVGAIALDLAATAQPARVVGVDPDEAQIALARTSAVQRAIGNVRFEVGSAYEIPFPNCSFDVVYANAVVFYLREPALALAEMRRVLRPGGLAAVSDDNLSTIVFSPDLPELRLAASLFERAVAHEGGNTRYSQHLRGLMLDAGFARTEGFAHAPEVYGNAEATRRFADLVIGLLMSPTIATTAIDECWATQAGLDAVIDVLNSWALRPDAFAAWLYCAALGWID